MDVDSSKQSNEIPLPNVNAPILKKVQILLEDGFSQLGLGLSQICQIVSICICIYYVMYVFIITIGDPMVHVSPQG